MSRLIIAAAGAGKTAFLVEQAVDKLVTLD